ncbi:hypothetical protein Tco_0782892 [Tanacetum coccineum]
MLVLQVMMMNRSSTCGLFAVSLLVSISLDVEWSRKDRPFPIDSMAFVRHRVEFQSNGYFNLCDSRLLKNRLVIFQHLNSCCGALLAMKISLDSDQSSPDGLYLGTLVTHALLVVIQLDRISEQYVTSVCTQKNTYSSYTCLVNPIVLLSASLALSG